MSEEARQGSEPAFQALFEYYYSRIYGFVCRICLDTAAAQDVTQESFIKAARSIRQLREGQAFRFWIYQIARNQARDWLRQRQRRRRLEEELACLSEEGRSFQNEVEERLHEVLGELPADLRESLVLVYFEDLNHAQAGKIMGISETTVSWRVFRAKRILKKKLQGKIFV